MATDTKNLAKKEGAAAITLQGLLDRDEVKSRFKEMLGQKSAGFTSSILSAVNTNPALKDADPMSVVAAAAIAASLDLPINPNLGFAHIVPYKDRNGKSIAQFQMGWKGFVQLGLRTGQYENIHAAAVYEGELANYDRFTGEVTFNPDGRTSDKIVGYVAYFKLLNGFKKWHWMTVEEVMAHGKKYSKSFSKETSQWKQNPDAMALKTVIKLLLSKFGILSIGMEKAIQADQAIIREDGSYEYVDRGNAQDKTMEVFGRFTETEGKALPESTEGEASCTKDVNTCGKALGPDEGRYGCQDTGENCPYWKEVK